MGNVENGSMTIVESLADRTKTYKSRCSRGCTTADSEANKAAYRLMADMRSGGRETPSCQAITEEELKPSVAAQHTILYYKP